MPGKAPEIVLRDFAQITGDLKLLIPRYLPEWTDHNASDPGITLLELFAYLADAYAYRLNQVPDELYDKLLALLAIRPDAARPATVQLQFTTAPASTADPIVVPRQTVVSATGTDGRPVYFETEQDVAVTRYPLATRLVFDGTPREVTGDFAPLGSSPAPGNALYLGFGPADPNVPANLAPFPSEVRLHVVPVPLDAAVRADDAGTRPIPTPPVRLQWEYLVDRAANRWERLQVTRDGSVAFTREGDVQVAGPPKDVRPFTDVAGEQRSIYWMRCRLLSGAYPADSVPRLTALEVNSIRATAWRSVVGELLGTSSGRPDQTVRLANESVDADALIVEVAAGSSAPAAWQRKDDLFASEPRDTHFVLDPATGAITFGDGARGLIPPAGAEIRATYRYGGGARGNLPAGTATGLQGLVPGVTGVTNLRPGVGGSDPQTTEQLRERAPSMLRARERAVTARDLEEAARGVPGVARARAVPLAHPELPGVQVPGAVTVVVVPTAHDVRDRTPRPTPELLDAVARRLDARRPATAEVWVTGPVYRVVRVLARIQIKSFASPDAVRVGVREALDRFLSPGAAAPATATSTAVAAPRDFGEDLYPTSLYAALLEVPDVVSVPVLRLWVDEDKNDDLTRSVPLAPNELLASADQHEIIVVPAADTRGAD